MARFIATSINLPTVDNSAITMIRSGSKLYSICEFQGMHKAYFYWQIEFNDTFPIHVKGLNRPQIDITPWDGKAFKVRLSVTYRGENRYLEADNVKAGTAKVQAPIIPEPDKTIARDPVASVPVNTTTITSSLASTLDSTLTSILGVGDTFDFDSQEMDDLVISAAANFKKSQNQDAVHNAILTFLLKSLDTIQEDHQQAYDALEHGLNNPLHHIRKSSGIAKVKNSDFFIRDFLMLHTQGGESARSPIMLNKISIRDGAIGSDFAYEFDSLVDLINERNAGLGLRRDVNYFSQLAHRDGLQLIPKSASLNQFMGATMSHVTLRDNIIESEGALQGIFASDGAFRNLHIINNRIRTDGQHTISIAGMLSGKISHNEISLSPNGITRKPTLHPLRIGGGANIKILSFSNRSDIRRGDEDYYEYETIEGNQALDDFRSIKPDLVRGTATYWHDVDLPKLQKLYPATQAQVKRLAKWPHEIPRTWRSMMQQVGAQA